MDDLIATARAVLRFLPQVWSACFVEVGRHEIQEQKAKETWNCNLSIEEMPVFI
jgi:hypothetical protein